MFSNNALRSVPTARVELVRLQCKYCKAIVDSPMPFGWTLAKNDMFRYVCHNSECKDKEERKR